MASEELPVVRCINLYLLPNTQVRKEGAAEAVPVGFSAAGSKAIMSACAGALRDLCSRKEQIFT
jgi:hypothetical protein